MRRLPLAQLLGLSLLNALPAAAELPAEPWFSSCDGPAATCLVPHTSHGCQDAPHAATQATSTASAACGVRPAQPIDAEDYRTLAYAEGELTPTPDRAREILARWEHASHSSLPVTEAERLRLRHAYAGRSGHEIDRACEFQGPVDANDLVDRYEWSTASEIGNVVWLTATPHDPVERMFYERFTIALDAMTWLPSGLRFDAAPASSQPTQDTIALHPWSDADAGPIELAGFDDERSDDERPIRTADLSDDSPRLLRREASLTLPPAPIPCDFVTPLEPIEAPKPLDMAEPTALREVLDKYDRNYASAKRVELELTRWSVNSTFGHEQRADVVACFEDHDRGWMESTNLAPAVGRSKSSGFEQKPADVEGWRWDDTNLTRYDPLTNVAIHVHSRDELRRCQISDSFWMQLSASLAQPASSLTIWTGENSEFLREHYRLKLVSYADVDVVCVQATPRTRTSRFAGKRIDILFDRASGQPMATRLYDLASDGYTIFSARRIALNESRPPVKALKPRSEAVQSPERESPDESVVADAPSLTRGHGFGWLLTRLLLF